MELTLHNKDLLPAFRHLNASQTKYEHFSYNARKAIRIVGCAQYRWYNCHNEILSAPKRLGRPRVYLHDWNAVDWTKQDCVLSRELKCPASYLCKWRHRLGKPKALTHHKGSGLRKDSNTVRKIADAKRMREAGFTLKKIGECLGGLSRERARQLLKM